MNTRLDLKKWIVILITLMLVTAGGLVIQNSGNLLSVELPVGLPAKVSTTEESFDYAQAADNLAYRWQAMADFYEEHGLLTRDSFDYAQAADNLAYRWQAMANFYEEQDLLTRDTFDYDRAADNLAYRWQAMAEYYKEHGLLNDKD